MTAGRHYHYIAKPLQQGVAALLAFACVCHWAAPARAIDCAKAKTPVEKAICTNEKLKKDDAHLSKRFFADLKSARESGFLKDGKSLHEMTLARQREWLAQREKTCGGMQGDKVDACVADFMHKRGDELYHQEFDTVGAPPEGLTLGTEKLLVGKREDGETPLLHNGKVLITSYGWGKQPFMVLQHWSSKETSAALIGTEHAGADQCTTTFVVEMRKPGEVVKHDLGEGCAWLQSNEVKRDQRGFSVTDPATPTQDGKTTAWIAQTGTLSVSRVKFKATAGSTMTDLLRRERPEFEGPLNYADFYTAANRLSAADRTRVMEALWRVESGCSGCRSTVNQTLYGVRITPEAIAYSGCGLRTPGAEVVCGGPDALAVWDRKTGAFYFAVAPHSDDRRHPDAAGEAAGAAPGGLVHFYPASSDWSAAARAELELWKNGAKWTETSN